MELEGASVVSVGMEPGANGHALETAELLPCQVTWRYTEQLDDGSAGGNVEFSYDFSR